MVSLALSMELAAVPVLDTQLKRPFATYIVNYRSLEQGFLIGSRMSGRLQQSLGQNEGSRP